VTQPTVREQLLLRLERAGASVDPSVAAALELYVSLLARWNRSVNLTALPLDPPGDETFDRLLVEPIVAAEHLELSYLSGAPLTWIDLGSGGGSPAIPLKLVRPSWGLTMVEAKERKAAFLRDAIRVLHLREAAVENVRFERFEGRFSADIVTVRAVKLDGALGDVVRILLKRDGILAVFSSSEASMPGFIIEKSVSLIPKSTAVLTLLRVPRGTQSR